MTGTMTITPPDRNPGVVGHQAEAIGPEPDEHLLTERDLPGIACQQVPHLSHDEEEKHFA